MRLESESFSPDQPIPDEFAFGTPSPETHVEPSGNRNPHLAWSDVPGGCRSFTLLCVDPDVPTVGDEVNQEGRTVPADLPRTDFCHWLLVDVPADCREIAAGSCSQGVTAGGKDGPAGPAGSRQGVNDYTGWFQDDEAMRGTYHGYDGPGPPWNDELVHHYHFTLFALDTDRLDVPDGFTLADVRRAMEGHVLAQAEIVGTYTLNPALR